MIDELVAQRNGIEREIERRSALVVKTWLLSHELTEVRVDDEHEQPSYAQDFADDGLDRAIGWLPTRLFHNRTQLGWNPVIRVGELDEFLAETAPADSSAQETNSPPSTVWLEFNEPGGASWSGFTDEELDRICAFIEAIKPPDTIAG